MSKQYILKNLYNGNYQIKKPITFDVIRPKRIVTGNMKTMIQEEVWEDKLSRIYSKDSSIVPYVLRYPIKIGNWYLWDYGRTLKEVVFNMGKGLVDMYKDHKDYDNGVMDKSKYETINEGGNICYSMKSHVIGCNAEAHKALLYNYIMKIKK